MNRYLRAASVRRPMGRLAIACLAAVPLILSSPQSASATDNTTSWHWFEASPSFTVSTSMPEAWRYPVRQGAYRWVSGTQFNPTYAGLLSHNYVDTAAHNVVFRQIPASWQEGCPSAVTLACARTTAVVEPGHCCHLTDADIVFNPDFESEFETDNGLCTLRIGFDVATVALHEFGHFGGLDHSDDFTSRMSAEYLAGAT